MDEGRAQVVISVNGSVTVTMTMTIVIVRTAMPGFMSVMMIMFATQQIRAQQINAEPDHRNGNRFVKRDRHRLDQTLDAFVTDQQRDDGEHYSAGKIREIAEFACSERSSRA